MSSYNQNLYQIVFGTKYHHKTMTKDHRTDLYKYISGILEHKKCHLYIINGVEEHLHILTHLHPSIALADLIKDIKIASSKYIKENKLFPDFDSWQVGYGAFTYSRDSKENLINYIKNQEEHHRIITFEEEFIALLKEHKIEYDERYLFE